MLHFYLGFLVVFFAAFFLGLNGASVGLCFPAFFLGFSAASPGFCLPDVFAAFFLGLNGASVGFCLGIINMFSKLNNIDTAIINTNFHIYKY